MNQDPSIDNPELSAALSDVLSALGNLGVSELTRHSLEARPAGLVPLAKAVLKYVHHLGPESGFGSYYDLVPESMRGTYNAEELDQLRQKGLEVTSEEYRPTGNARRFLLTSLGVEKDSRKAFWSQLDANHKQIVAFSEIMLADHARDFMSRESRVDEIRLSLQGYSDSVICEMLASHSRAAVSVFRGRMKQMLINKHKDGIHTLRRQLATCLHPEQQKVLRAEFPDSFPDEPFGDDDPPAT